MSIFPFITFIKQPKEQKVRGRTGHQAKPKDRRSRKAMLRDLVRQKTQEEVRRKTREVHQKMQMVRNKKAKTSQRMRRKLRDVVVF
jgi:hypothetical protein